ncbi:MAG: D-cysteine desulfhydrase family protein [Clostridia bacterium]|nr:D-cysteine desulfhydrase family protein [Clostridia bacterium]MBQ3062072.1 D-cysteine desulfhydrase family protein [Clostridia bacterium]
MQKQEVIILKIEGKKVNLTSNLPTPLEYLPSISKELGVEFYIKRDDLTSLAMGGNKMRKLEYLAYEALEQGATMLVTAGGAQTNHGRQTAGVAAKLGLKCAIACLDNYPGEISANILLDRLMGADVVFRKPTGAPGEQQAFLNDVIAHYEAQGEKVYFIPFGGSNDVGMLGYYECACELDRQAKAMGIEDATVISAVGSIGTYMGLWCGLKNEGSPLNLTGIAILPFGEDREKRLMEYFASAKESFGLECEAERGDFHIETGYVRGGYNLPNEDVRKAVYLMARKEAIILDPCYTGKAFAGLIDMINEGKIKKGEKIIFLHSGGHPGINTPHHRVEFERELQDGIIMM